MLTCKMPKSNTKSIINTPKKLMSPSVLPKSLPTEVHSKLPTHDPSNYAQNVAVHFGNFYSHKKHDLINDQRSSVVNERSHATKSDFSQHMVHKLEKLTGTIDYSRKVAALLDEIVEPPNFSIKSPSADNCAPGDDLDASYPLWYKDPDKMSFFVTVAEEEFFNDKLNINQDNCKGLTTETIPSDEWDLPISPMYANEVGQNRQVYYRMMRKKFRQLNNILRNCETAPNECKSFVNDSESSDGEITVE